MGCVASGSPEDSGAPPCGTWNHDPGSCRLPGGGAGALVRLAGNGQDLADGQIPVLIGGADRDRVLARLEIADWNPKRFAPLVVEAVLREDLDPAAAVDGILDDRDV